MSGLNISHSTRSGVGEDAKILRAINIGILAHVIAGMLYPFVYAQDESDNEDKMTARAMRILVEERLRNAGPNKQGYEVKFFYAVLCALVNPAAFVEVEYIEVLQNIRQKREDGTMSVEQAVDEAMSGLMLHICPIDEILLGDLWSGTGDMQAQPFYFRVRRISYDNARKKYAGKYFYNEKDLFDYVHAGQTRVAWLTQEGVQLFDIDWDDADGNFVQELTVFYKGEDLQLTWLGGVGMFDHNRPYDNPIKHRRMVSGSKGWYTTPHYPIAMTGFEPIDPTGRFAYFKSGAFKEYWEDLKITELDRMLVDGVKLDVFKPMFLSGVAKVDGSVMVPGSTATMPQGASATPYQLGPNLVAAHEQITQAAKDMSESTQDKIMQGQTEKDITATQTIEARENARKFLGVFVFMVAGLVKQIGELTMDVIVRFDTAGDLEGYVGGELSMKYKHFISRGKEKGKDVTHKIIFSDKFMGKGVPESSVHRREWELYKRAGGEDSTQRIWEINPYRFARTKYSMFVDADQIISRSVGTDRMEKDRAFERLTDPRVMPFIDPEAVVSDFVIEEYADGDPDRYKRKGSQQELVDALLGNIEANGSNVIEPASAPV